MTTKFKDVGEESITSTDKITPTTRFSLEYDYNRLKVFEVGASILTWLAYPPRNNSALNELPSDHALVLWALHQKALREPEWALTQNSSPEISFSGSRKSKESLP